jgi:tRNA U34 5-methylaminomethyl-2-thiouridine-forming methyltransferase MnmC
VSDHIKLNGLGEAVKTKDGSLSFKSPDFDECFHSDSGALSETLGLYLGSSGILTDPRPALHVLDVGLGLGYNAWHTIRDVKNLSLIVSIEQSPALVQNITQNMCYWLEKPNTDRWEESEANVWQSLDYPWRIECTDFVTADLGFRGFDYIWFDPFSPKNNPQMWSEDVFKKIASLANENAVLMTYSVAKEVRLALERAGCQLTKIPTTTQKKHWLKATFSQTQIKTT